EGLSRVVYISILTDYPFRSLDAPRLRLSAPCILPPLRPLLPVPEQPERKRRSIDVAPLRRPQMLRYAEFHLKTNFSFRGGASDPEELVSRAAEFGYAAMAVTDRNSLAGVVRAHIQAKQMQLKLLIGGEIPPLDAPPVVLLATDRAAYGRLVRLITLGR